MIIAIDPGPEQSAVVVYDQGKVVTSDFEYNLNVLDWLYSAEADHLAIEMVACYGMPVGKEVFETCLWIGRFIEAWEDSYTLVYRRDIKLHLCQSARANDSNVRQALIDRFGGSKEKAIGKKANPGPLHGISSHLWAALAVAVTYEETKAAVPAE